MARPGWVVRLYDPQDYDKTYQFVGNYKDLGDREADDLIVFEGLYGIDSYLVWYLHKDLPHQDMSTINIELRFFLDGDLGKPNWKQRYKIIDLRYSASESRYYLYAISIDSAKLQTKLTDYNIRSLSHKSDRTPEQVLIDVLEKGIEPIFRVKYHKGPSSFEKELRNFEYWTLSINDDWTVADFINYIAEQNKFEWLVKKGILHIGKELRAKDDFAANFTQLPIDNVTETSFYKKYHGDYRPFETLTHIEKKWKCIWVKQYVGKSGGTTKACWTRIGGGTLDKEIYLRSLEDDPEKNFGVKLFDAKGYSDYVLLGNIIKDYGGSEIEEVSVQKNRKAYATTKPHQIVMDRGKDTAYPLTNIKQYLDRSTPYLDHNAGMLFPSPVFQEQNEEGEWIDVVPPNNLIFNIKGKEESSVAGPFVFGSGDPAWNYPEKGINDFRFTFRNGWTWYTAQDGRTIIQSANLPMRSPDNTYFQFPYPGDQIYSETASETGKYNPDGQKESYIYMRPRILEYDGSVLQDNVKVSLNAGGVGGDSNLLGCKLRVEKSTGFTAWCRKAAARVQKASIRIQSALPALPDNDEIMFDTYDIPAVDARTTLYMDNKIIELHQDLGGPVNSDGAKDWLLADTKHYIRLDWDYTEAGEGWIYVEGDPNGGIELHTDGGFIQVTANQVLINADKAGGSKIELEITPNFLTITKGTTSIEMEEGKIELIVGGTKLEVTASGVDVT